MTATLDAFGLLQQLAAGSRLVMGGLGLTWVLNPDRPTYCFVPKRVAAEAMRAGWIAAEMEGGDRVCRPTAAGMDHLRASG